MTRQVYFIREKSTNSWCYSSGHKTFSIDFDYATIYSSEENAEKAIKVIMKTDNWRVDEDTYRTKERATSIWDGVEIKIPELEVVSFDLIASVK